MTSEELQQASESNYDSAQHKTTNGDANHGGALQAPMSLEETKLVSVK